MFSFRRTAIIIFPEQTGRIFKIRVPVLFLRLIIPFVLFLGILSGLFIHEYRAVKDRLHLLNLQEAIYEQDRRQILRLAGRIIRIRQETEKLEMLSPGVEPYTLAEQEKPAHTLVSAGYDPAEGIPGLIRLMHGSLDHLDKKLDLFLHAIKKVPEISPLEQDLYKTRFKSYVNDPQIPDVIRKELVAASKELGLNPLLAFAMADVESGFDAAAVSSKGAIGVLQVMPDFALEEHGITRDMLFNPKVNIRIGLSMIKDLLDRFHQNLDLSLAAYNAGASRVINAGYRIPDIAETRAYVTRVKEAMTEESLPVYASG